jgi:hypothetical protein
MSLGGSSLRNLGLGFVLSAAIIAGLAYMGRPSPCSGTSPRLTHAVAPPEVAAAITAASKPGRP